jgi:hypothetical protein
MTAPTQAIASIQERNTIESNDAKQEIKNDRRDHHEHETVVF